MSLKLIREALLHATLSDADIKALSIIKEATGAESIVDLVSESFTPSADDFDAWMRVVVGEAQDRGINLSKKANFMELVMDVLENDPAMPPIEMQEAIATKLWQDYQSAKNEVRINKIAAAKEEEEKVAAARKQIADRFARQPEDRIHSAGMRNAYDEEETVDDFLKRGGTVQQLKMRKPRAGEKWQGSAHIGKSSERPGRSTTGKAANTRGLPVIGMRKRGTEEEESGFEQAFNVAKGIEDEEHTSFLSDVLKTRTTRAGARSPTSFSSHLRGFEDENRDVEFDEMDPDVTDAEPGVFTSTDDEFDDTTVDTDFSDDESVDGECECPCASDNTESEMDVETDDEFGPPEDELDDDTMDDVDADVSRGKPEKFYDEEEAVKSFFRQAATAPRNMMTQAIKDIESEGASAWKQANVPANPHPKKSAAYRAWQKGLLAAAKESLGIVDKPKDMKTKKKK